MSTDVPDRLPAGYKGLFHFHVHRAAMGKSQIRGSGAHASILWPPEANVNVTDS